MLMLQIFVYLQLLDLVTTLLGFRVGAVEASPFIAKLIHSSSPILGVAASKGLAIGIGAVCMFTGRARLVGWINYWYAGLVIWNLSIIMIAVSRHA